MDHESIDLLLTAEGSFYIDWRGWLLLTLLLVIFAWGLWDDARREQGDE